MSVTGGPQIPSLQNLVTYVDISNSKCMVSGSTIPNDLANNATITAHNGTPIYSSQVGGSIRILGSEGYRLIYPTVRNINRNYTNVAWAYYPGATFYRNIIDNLFGDNHFWGVNAGKLNLYTPTIDTTVNMPVNQWTHYALTISSGSSIARFYLNGLEVYSASASNAGVITSQSWISGPDEGWTGSLALVGIYNRELSSEEIYNHYTQTKARFGL